VTSRTFRLLLHLPAVRALLEACGPAECHLVGGILRDRALGLPSHDVDAVVAEGEAGRSPSGWRRRCRPGWSFWVARNSPPTGWWART
jgi:hypothetical protein